jgi:hypothetical protein
LAVSNTKCSRPICRLQRRRLKETGHVRYGANFMNLICDATSKDRVENLLNLN